MKIFSANEKSTGLKRRRYTDAEMGRSVLRPYADMLLRSRGRSSAG